ncbi:kelch-like protein 3 isoform X2 [Littorina saxatilis]|uniref:BTB domain-containing protein n=1 Tax=Littorina saxatilis TaxID=31220 RepID=A0AAN9GC92_9CAEN
MKRLTVTAKDMPDGTRTLMGKNAGNTTLARLRDLRRDKSLCDVILLVDGGEIPAHRNILIVNSDYFRSMFTDGFHETLTREIPLPERSLDRETADTLIDFMYNGNLTVTPNTVQGLIMAADQWQMTDVKDLCVEYMERQIDAQNCLGVLPFAETYRCEKLAKRSMQLIKQQFPAVVLGAEFLSLSMERLEQILDLDDLNLGHEGEDVVLRAVFRWLGYNKQDRLDDLPTLLNKVRLSKTSGECRKQLLEKDEAVQENEELLQLIENLMKEPQPVRNAQTTLYVIGGFLQSRTGPTCPRVNGVERLDAETNNWIPCADFPMRSSGSVSFSVHSHLFCAAFAPVQAGNANLVSETRIFEYNFIRDEWLDAHSCFSPESLEYIDNCLQAEGALAVCKQTNTIYTVSRDEVSSITVNLIDGAVFCRNARLLPRPRPEQIFSAQHRLHAAVVVDRKLYVIGGDRHDNGSDPVATARVIMYDPDRNVWASRCDMTEPRATVAVAELNGKIYACGGFNTRRLATMEQYDPVTDTWTTLTPMNKYRSHHKILVLDNKIWAIGGKSYSTSNGGARKVINLCEIYNPEENAWFHGPPMKQARCGFAAVAI